MAKKQARTAASTNAATPVLELSTKVRTAVEGIRKQFNQYTKAFSALAISREELAPKFMKAANLWMAETSKSFVDFVRYLEPAIGNNRAEYRNHRTYQAADYLRRLAGRAEARGRPRTAAERAQAPAPPTDAIASIVASLMTIIPTDRQDQVWEAMATRLHWTPRQINRLQTQVQHVDPLVQIRARVEGMRLTFPTGTAVAAPEGERQAA